MNHLKFFTTSFNQDRYLFFNLVGKNLKKKSKINDMTHDKYVFVN